MDNFVDRGGGVKKGLRSIIGQICKGQNEKEGKEHL